MIYYFISFELRSGKSSKERKTLVKGPYANSAIFSRAEVISENVQPFMILSPISLKVKHF